MCSDIAISVRNLSKTYRIFDHPGDRLKQALTFGLVPFHREFTALQDVSFDIKKGETVGIVGRNGSGKSTLLQLLCGILKPSSGSVTVNGRISALLELGAGFNPEFTGRENVYFQGALMGFTKRQMDERFDEIAAFADIGEFIDQPVRMYSSGMFVRLAFSAMIHADAEVLVIDEALAVGDEEFQRRCFDKLSGYLEDGNKTLLFVSHNVRQIERLCSRVILLEKGWLAQQGAASDICRAYQDSANVRLMDACNDASIEPNVAYTGELDVERLQFYSAGCSHPEASFEVHSNVRLEIDFHCSSVLSGLDVVVRFHTVDSVFIAAATTADIAVAKDFSVGNHRIECHFSDLFFLPGVYQIRLGFISRQLRPVWVGHGVYTFQMVGSVNSNSMRTPSGLVDIPFEWDFADTLRE